MQLKEKGRNEFYFYLFTFPWILGFLLFTAFPVFYSLYLSFTDFGAAKVTNFVGFANYIDLFTNDFLFWKAVKATVTYTFISVPVSLTLSLIFALLINQKVPLKRIFRTAMYLPSVVSGVTMALLWTWLFNPQIGLVNYVLSFVGIKGPAWLLDKSWALPAIILMSFWGMGSGMIIFLAALQGVPASYYEAARLDGANAWHRFWKITLPMISPVFLFQLIMTIIGSFQIFNEAYVMTKGGPNYSTYFYVYYLQQAAFMQFKIGKACALGWILLLVVMTIAFIIIKYSDHFVHYEGGKN